jgi:hypothetical protein
VYTWKDPARLVAEIAERRVHRADALELYTLPAELLDAAARTLDRVNKWELAVSGQVMYLTIGGVSLEGAVTRT